MNKIIQIFSLMTLSVIVMGSYVPITQESMNPKVTKQTIHISPEIVNEFKDFANLISATTIDEIVAKHYLVDGNFRTAFKYLRSQEFTQLQQQLLDIPEIIDILEFLHLTTTNATTRHMGATKMTMVPGKTSIDDYNDDDAAADSDADNRVVKMTTNTGSTTNIISQPNTLYNVNLKGAMSYKKVYKRPQRFEIADFDGAYAQANAIGRISNEQQEKEPLVDIVLLENTEVNANVYNKHHQKHHHHNYQQHHLHLHKYQHHCNNNYNHHHLHHHSSLGTFTAFVDEVLQHLPHSAYQNMIKEKCQKNSKFAEFYKALRSPALKPLIDQSMVS